jgi:flagellar hook-associated protein 2
MASTSFISGLSSGLDWATMLTQLVAVERKPITLLTNNKTEISKEKSAWSDLNTNLLSLQTASGSLSAVDDFNVFTMSSTITGTTKSVGDLLSFAAGSNASIGSNKITISQLATAQKRASTTFTSTSAELGLSGDLTINGSNVTIAATDSLSAIQTKINALNSGTTPTGVTASIISVSSTEHRLTLTSDTTGVAGFSITDGTGSLGLTELVAGKDAMITVDGYAITRSSNQISDVISGVTLNLVGADAGATVTLNVGRDYDGIKKKIQDFVDNYNKVMTYIATQNTAPATGATASPLYADSSLRSIRSTLSSTLLSGVSGLSSTLDHLSLIGISVDRTGKLSIDDSTKLDGYLKTNFNDVVNLFADNGTSTGIAKKFDDALSAMTDSVDGYVATKQSSLQTMMDNIDKKISAMEDRLNSYTEALSAKFTRMETLLSTLKSQQSYLTSQIDSLSSSK